MADRKVKVAGHIGTDAEAITGSKTRERRTLEQRIAHELAAERAHLARAEAAKARRLALLSEQEAKARAILADVERARETGE